MTRGFALPICLFLIATSMPMLMYHWQTSSLQHQTIIDRASYNQKYSRLYALIPMINKSLGNYFELLLQRDAKRQEFTLNDIKVSIQRYDFFHNALLISINHNAIMIRYVLQKLSTPIKDYDVFYSGYTTCSMLV